MTKKGFIKDWQGYKMLPITRGELVLDKDGKIALNSIHFLAENGHPGLVTADERALLMNTGANTEGIQEIYSKLMIINSGLQVNTNTLNFYNTKGEATPINITSLNEGKLNITTVGNDINFNLPNLHSQDLNINGFIDTLKIDKQGRLTEASSRSLTNADIPDLNEKTISKGVLDQCQTKYEDISDSNTAIVNKAYVDKKVQELTILATGALKFGGPISRQDEAIKKITENKHANYYFKVTDTFVIPSQYLYSETETLANLEVKSGDTLIVYPLSNSKCRFVYVPSGNDITTITVKNNSSSIISKQVGDITFQFSQPFNVSKTDLNNITVSMNPADHSHDGYLSKSDYALFKSYSDDLKTLYTPIVNNTTKGSYQLGTLSVGTKDYPIYGVNNTTTVSLTNGISNSSNPILKFTETNKDDVLITYKGLNGIKIVKNDNNIEFSSDYEIVNQKVPQSGSGSRYSKYLTLQDNKFGVQLGSIDSEGNVIDGLTDYSQFAAAVNKLAQTVVFEDIVYSLKGSTSFNEYRYGNAVLASAVDIGDI